MSQAGSRHAPRASELELVEAVGELATRIDALQSEVRRLSAPNLPPLRDPPGDGASDSERFAWIAALEPPVRRAPRIPRLALEVLFLLATATAAGLARLDALVVVAVMAGAWALVALLESTALRAGRSRPLDVDAPVARVREALASDPAWLVPPVQHTVIEPGPEPETAVAPLPPTARRAEAESEA